MQQTNSEENVYHFEKNLPPKTIYEFSEFFRKKPSNIKNVMDK